MSKQQFEAAYVLHRRPFRETSCILDVFTRHHGRIPLIAKGVRKAKSSKQALLQAFLPLEITWSGKSELQTLTRVESKKSGQRLLGSAIACGFYANELIIKLTHQHDAHPQLFDCYQQLLQALQDKSQQEFALRRFEIALLAEIGYALSSAEIEDQRFYTFSLDSGFIPVNRQVMEITCFRGAEVKQLLADKPFSNSFKKTAKHIMRFIMQQVLQQKQIKARELFIY